MKSLTGDLEPVEKIKMGRTGGHVRLCRSVRARTLSAALQDSRSLFPIQTRDLTLMVDTQTKPPLEDPLHEREMFANEIAGIAMIHRKSS